MRIIELYAGFLPLKTSFCDELKLNKNLSPTFDNITITKSAKKGNKPERHDPNESELQELPENEVIKSFTLDEERFKHISLVAEWNKSKPLNKISYSEFKILLRNCGFDDFEVPFYSLFL